MHFDDAKKLTLCIALTTTVGVLFQVCELIDTFADMKTGKFQKRIISQSPENAQILAGRGTVIERDDMITVRGAVPHEVNGDNCCVTQR